MASVFTAQVTHSADVDMCYIHCICAMRVVCSELCMAAVCLQSWSHLTAPSSFLLCSHKRHQELSQTNTIYTKHSVLYTQRHQESSHITALYTTSSNPPEAMSVTKQRPCTSMERCACWRDIDKCSKTTSQPPGCRPNTHRWLAAKSSLSWPICLPFLVTSSTTAQVSGSSAVSCDLHAK